MDLVHVGATWLHLLATVALGGYYAILGLIVLPVLRRFVPASDLGEAIAAVERRALPVIVVSLGVFLATGVYLMGIDTQYGGLGNVTGSTWSTLILAKHGVVAVMVGLGVYLDALIIGHAAREAGEQAAALRRVSLAAGAMTLLGVLVLFLTAAAQAS
jgi:uncharacterized membrane protein